MKKAIILIGILCCTLSAMGQASTIKDYGDVFVLEYDHGDTIPLYKADVFPWKSSRGVRLYTSEKFIPSTVQNNLLDLAYGEFGFANDTVLRDYVVNLVGKIYTPAYAYEATYGNPDTIWYILGNTAADTGYIWVGTYSGDSLTNEKIIHP